MIAVISVASISLQVDVISMASISAGGGVQDLGRICTKLSQRVYANN